MIIAGGQDGIEHLFTPTVNDLFFESKVVLGLKYDLMVASPWKKSLS
jgi:hypothetical protein